MRCLNCSEENPDGAVNCMRCGVKLEARTCTRCGGAIRGKSRFCIHCGNSLFGETPAPRSRKRQPAAPSPPPQYAPPPPQRPRASEPRYDAPQPHYNQGPQQVDYSYGAMPDNDKQTLKDKTILLKEQFGAVIKKGNYKEVLQDRNHPATQSFIDFIAWGITHFYGFAALVGAITFLGILMGGWGVVFGLALAFVYATYKKEIDQRVEELKGNAGTPAQSSYSVPSAPVEQPRYRYTTARTRDYYYQIHGNCNGCGACVPFCRNQAIFQISQQYLIDQTRCNQCGDCEYQCPVRAIIRIRD